MTPETAAPPAGSVPAGARASDPSPTEKARLDFDAIGTHWQIETPHPLDAEVREAVSTRIERFDRAYSRFRPDSLVTALAQGAGEVDFPADSVDLFALYDRLAEASQGAVDPLVGRDLELLGYDATYSLRASPRAADARERPSWGSLMRSPTRASGTRVSAPGGTVIDVGAAGKGYLVDRVVEVLREHGATEFVVDASGDLAHAGPAPLRVALEHPSQPGKAIGVAEFAGASLCASASNRRVWGEGLHHILDGRTGNPARDVVATWVVAESTALADGLATALFFTGAHQLAKTFHFSYVRMYADGRAERSRDFPGEIFR